MGLDFHRFLQTVHAGETAARLVHLLEVAGILPQVAPSARSSTTTQLTRSLGAQRKQIEAFTVARAWTLVDVIEEQMPGVADVRPELEQLHALVRTRKVWS